MFYTAAVICTAETVFYTAAAVFCTAEAVFCTAAAVFCTAEAVFFTADYSAELGKVIQCFGSGQINRRLQRG